MARKDRERARKRHAIERARREAEVSIDAEEERPAERGSRGRAGRGCSRSATPPSRWGCW